MQSTSQVWRDLWAAGANLEARAIIEGTVYADLPSVPLISRGLMQDGPGIGNAVSAVCVLSVRTNDELPRAAEVAVEMRLTDGTTASEWLPAGTFYISRRSRDPVTGVVALECYDALLKGNSPLSEVPWTTEEGEPVTTEDDEWIYFNASFPRDMESLVADIALLMGVQLDERTELASGDAYVINGIAEGESIHDVLCRIAAANGGNWIITPANRLRLVPFEDATNADDASVDVVVVDGVIGGISVMPSGTVTGIRYGAEDNAVVLGDDTGLVIDAGEHGAAFAQALYDRLEGMAYRPYVLADAVYDPAAELGDYVRAGATGEVASVLCVEAATIGPGFRGSVSAPQGGETSDEYPYLGSASNKALVAARAYAQKITQQLSDSLDQEGVFNRLTNNGEAQGVYLYEGRVYINGSYMQIGTIRGANGKNYWVLDGDDPILVAQKGQIGAFLLDNYALSFVRELESGPRYSINMSGGGLETEFYNNDTGNTNTTNLYGGSVIFGWNDDELYSIACSDSMLFVRLRENGVYDFPVQIYNSTNQTLAHTIITDYNVQSNKNLHVKGDFRVDGEVTGTMQFAAASGLYMRLAGNYMRIRNDANTVYTYIDSDGIYTTGNLVVSGGTKSRAVSTDQYGSRLLYCYETPSPLFGDVGEGVIGEDGLCYVTIDPIFAQTINTAQYQVFLQRYGRGDCWVRERRAGWFVVEGEPGLAFGWEIKGKQSDFDQKRLDRNDEQFTIPTQDYGAEAAQYIHDLQKGRVSA